MLTADQVRLLAAETLAVHELDEDTGLCRRCGKPDCDAREAALQAQTTMDGFGGRVWPLA